MPTNFEPQSKLRRTLVLSANRQTAWGGVLPDAALTRIQRFDGSAVLDFTPDRRSDKAYSGKGSEFATNGQIVQLSTKFSGVKSELSDWLAGYVCAFLMGKDVVTGAAAPYTHTFTFDETTRQAIPTTVYLQDTVDLHYKLPDMAVNDATFTISDKGAIMVDFGFLGTGRYVAGSMTALPAVPAETYLLGSDADFQIGDVGAVTSILGRHMSTTLKLDNQLIEHRATGTGLTASFIRKGDKKFSLQSTVASKDTDDIFGNMIANTQQGITINCNSGAAAQMNITVPAANLKATKMGFDGDMTIWNIELDETTCYQAAGVPPITIAVLNSVASYLIAA